MKRLCDRQREKWKDWKTKISTTQRHRDHKHSIYETKLDHQQNAIVIYKVELGGPFFPPDSLKLACSSIVVGGLSNCPLPELWLSVSAFALKRRHQKDRLIPP